jgi:hypothetical protein
MKRLIVFSLVLFAGLIQIAEGQVRGIPPSVTSLAPGRQFLPGPSVTSLGPHGWDNAPVLLGNRHAFRRGQFSRGRHSLPVFVPYYSPYAVYPLYAEPDMAPADSYANDASSLYMPESNYAGAYSLRPPAQPSSQPNPAQTQEQQPAETVMATSPSNFVTQTPSLPEPQPTTVLVFKDGQKLDITNYVIQGSTLFNLDGKGPRKIPLADLNVKETVSENDNRGVQFSLP